MVTAICVCSFASGKHMGGPTLAKKNNAIKVKIETGKHLCQIDPFN